MMFKNIFVSLMLLFISFSSAEINIEAADGTVRTGGTTAISGEIRVVIIEIKDQKITVYTGAKGRERVTIDGSRVKVPKDLKVGDKLIIKNATAYETFTMDISNMMSPCMRIESTEIISGEVIFEPQ